MPGGHERRPNRRRIANLNLCQRSTYVDAVHTLTQRNAEFAKHRFTSGLRILPSLKTFVIGCVDPRVDPAQILGIDLGEVAVIRNIGGRVTSSLLKELALLRKLAQGAGGDFDQGWNFVVLQHTDCGILRMQGEPEQLADFFGIDTESLDTKKVGDPRAAVEIDVAVLKADPHMPVGLRATGLVYDVATGEVDTVIAPAPEGVTLSG
jgi:carbonic anhydrase